jgi:predicted glutamine amidotransferase
MRPFVSHRCTPKLTGVCRLFGMSGGRRRLRATFWLLEAPDSLAQQSHRNPDGSGLGTFEEDGTPEVDKRPVAAYEDEPFAREAREERSRTFVAHVRYASTGARTYENTHPFEQHGRLFAHNGAFLGLETLEQELGDHRGLVHGDTDSERWFALITKEIEAAGGDVRAGMTAATRWMAANLPVFSLNFVLTTASDLWALRYPESHELLVLERASGGPSGRRHLDAASPAGRVRVRSAELAQHASVVVATEQMDEDAGWRGLAPGELVHVDADLRVTSTTAVDGPPAHPLRLEDLEPRAADAMRSR